MAIRADYFFLHQSHDKAIAFQNELLACPVSGSLAYGLFRAERIRKLKKLHGLSRDLRAKVDGLAQESIKYLERCLEANAEPSGVRWGWAPSNDKKKARWGLAVSLSGLPTVVFRHPRNPDGHRYGKNLPAKNSPWVVPCFCDRVLAEEKSLRRDSLMEDDLMPFGEHAGTPLADLPAAYVRWLSQWNGVRLWPLLHRWVQEEAGAVTV